MLDVLRALGLYELTSSRLSSLVVCCQRWELVAHVVCIHTLFFGVFHFVTSPDWIHSPPARAFIVCLFFSVSHLVLISFLK
jgi:hypothetical protein